MKRLTLAIALLAGVTWLSPGAALATQEEQPEACFETEVFTEYLYERTVSTPTYGDVIEKEVKGKVQTKGLFFWNNTGTFDWIDWPGAGPLNDDGRNRGPGGHNSTFDQTGNSFGDTRKVSTQYRYVVVGQFQNGTEETTEQYGWTEEGPEKEGWTLIDQRESERQVEVECPPPVIPPVIPPPTIDPCLVNPSFCPPPTTPPVVPPTTEPPVVEPPVVEPPVVEPEKPEVIVPPVVDTGTPPQPPAAGTPEALPVTGTASWIIAGIAALLTAAGATLVYGTRRRPGNLPT